MVAGYARSSRPSSDSPDGRGERRVRDLRCEELDEALELGRVPSSGRRQAWWGRRRWARARGPRAAAGRGSARRGRGRGRRRLRRSGRRVARRRSRRERRSAPWRPRARARGTATRPGSAVAASSSLRTRPRRRGPPRDPRSSPATQSVRRAPRGGYPHAMPLLRPFNALRYDDAVVGPLGPLVAPPYDVIGHGERREYLDRSPFNVVHLTLPRPRGGGRARSRRLARRGSAARGRAGASGLVAGLRRPGRRGAHARGDRRARSR